MNNLGVDLLIGTSNKGKVIEISEVLSDLHVTIVTPEKLNIPNDPEETGDTFEANALQKARYFYENSNIATLADDSGIIIDALQDELGIHTRRWGAGKDATDEQWISYFLDRMKEEENRSARFVCVLAYIDHEGKEHLFEGTCNGVITQALEADYLPGLPISACFKPDGFDCVYSAMTVDQKNSISHRGVALQQFRNFLQNNI